MQTDKKKAQTQKVVRFLQFQAAITGASPKLTVAADLPVRALQDQTV